jgi:hypothetical protein
MLALQTFTLRSPVTRYSRSAYDRHGEPFVAEEAYFEIFGEDANASRSTMGRAAVAWARKLGLPVDRLEWNDRTAYNAYSGEVCGCIVLVTVR